MRHKYATEDGGPISPTALKGVDRLIYQAALLLRLETEVQALIEDDGKGYDREYKGVKAGWILSNRCDYGLFSYTEGYDSDSDNSCERKTREDLIWISKTGRQFLGGAYAHYGNEVRIIMTLSDTLGLSEPRLREWCHPHHDPRQGA